VRILRVEVENLRSIVKGRALLTEGVNFIHGPNGVGKTSLLEAMAIGLYGTDWLRGRVRLSELVRRGSDVCTIRLEVLGNDGGRYLIQRSFSRDKTLEGRTYVVDQGGRRRAARDREVTEFVLKITGIPMEVFSELLYIRQGEIRDILRTGARVEARLDRLLRLEAMQRVRQEILWRGRKELERIMEGIRGRLEVIEGEIRDRRGRLVALDGEIRELKLRVSDSEEMLRRIEEELGRFRARESELRGVEEEYVELARRLALLDGEMRKIEEHIAELRSRLKRIEEYREELRRLEDVPLRREAVKRELEALRSKYYELNEEITRRVAAESARNNLARQLEELRMRIRRLEEEIKKLGDPRNKLVEISKELSRVSKLEAQINELSRELSIIEAEANNLEVELRMLRSSSGTCPLCGQSISEELGRRLIASREARLVELSKRRGKLMDSLNQLFKEKERLEALRDELAIYERALGRYESILGELRELRSREGELMNQLATVQGVDVGHIREELGRVTSRIKELEAMFDELNKLGMRIAELAGMIKDSEDVARRIRELEERLRDMAQDRVSIEERLRVIEERHRELEDVRSRVRRLEEDRARLVRDLSEAKGKLAALEGEAERIRNELMQRVKERERLSEDLSRYESAMRLVSQLIAAIDEARPMVRRLFLDTVNAELNEMVREVMHKGSYIEVRVNDEYEVYVRRSDNVELNVDSLSVGERNVVALLLRYAIAKTLLGNIPILILDEPTEHLDEEHRRRIADWIRSLSNGVGTVLITSHVDLLETVADNVIRMNFINKKGESTFSNT